MQRSRLTKLKRRLGVNGPGLTVALIALIVALGGAAFASSDSGSATASKAKAKRGPTGPRGPKGATGPAGPAGPAGAQGPAGAAGAKGDSGAPGAAGKTGATGATGAAGATGAVGATGATGAAGATGATGATGEPWTPNSELPSGAIETGAWAFAGSTSDTNGIRVPISFPIKLAEELEASKVHYSTEPSFSTACEGVANFPKPKPDNLCVYVNNGDPVSGTTVEGIYSNVNAIEIEPLKFGIEKGAGRTGAVLVFAAPTGAAYGSGSYAVRAP